MTMTAPDNSLWLSDLNDAELVGLALGDGLRLAARRWGQAEAAGAS